MKYQYWFDAYSGLSNNKKIHLYNCGYKAKDVYYFTEAKLVAMNFLTEAELGFFLARRRSSDIDKLWLEFVQKDISFTSIEQDNYPQKLKNIINPPYALYYLGKLPDESKRSIAIVGARGRSAYGSAVAERIAKELAACGIQIISGLARGIDADGHSGALAVNGFTYGVLGCGVDICYPYSNKYIYNQIIKSGGIISELPPGTKAQSYFFPQRNRIIAGLSDAVIVVEAREKSGSLITADFAMEQGKDVYAVPGRITEELSGGCNKLIKQGAGIILSPSDLIEDLELMSENNYVQLDFMKKLLEKDETLVYSLTDFRPIDVGTLLEKTTFEISELLEILYSLEEKGYIKEVFHNHYVKTI